VAWGTWLSVILGVHLGGSTPEDGHGRGIRIIMCHCAMTCRSSKRMIELFGRGGTTGRL